MGGFEFLLGPQLWELASPGFLSSTTEACLLAFFKFHQQGLEHEFGGTHAQAPGNINFWVLSSLRCGHKNRGGWKCIDISNLLLRLSKFGDNSTNQKTFIEGLICERHYINCCFKEQPAIFMCHEPAPCQMLQHLFIESSPELYEAGTIRIFFFFLT